MSRLSHYQRLSLYRLCPILCLVLLSACGSNASSNDGGVTISSTPTSDTAFASPQSAYTLIKDANTTDLQIEMIGISCSLNGDSFNYPSNLVLASNQLTTDVGTAQSIQNYLQLLNNHINELRNWVPPMPPSLLHWQAGGKVCVADFQITNLSPGTLTLDRLGFRLTSASRPNTQSYRLINYCKNVNCYYPLGGKGGDPPPCSYGTRVSLHAAAGGTDFDNLPGSTNSDKCPLPLTLTHGGRQEVTVMFMDAAKQNISYSGIPTLTIETEHGKEVIAPAALLSTLTFTDGKSLPCYQFKHTEFYKEGDTSPACFQTNNQTA